MKKEAGVNIDESIEINDLFLELSNVTFSQNAVGPSEFAEPLTKYIELLETTERNYGVNVGLSEQKKIVSEALFDIDKAKALIEIIKVSVNNILDNFTKKQPIAIQSIDVKIVHRITGASIVTRYSLTQEADDVVETIKAVFANVADDMQLEPLRFRNCKNCGNRFYQLQRITMQYCSGKCSVAGRSRENYQKSKKQEMTPEQKADIGRQIRKGFRKK